MGAGGEGTDSAAGFRVDGARISSAGHLNPLLNYEACTQQYGCGQLVKPDLQSLQA